MKTVKINTSKQLEKFLKILAEESVIAAQADSEENRQKLMSKKIKSSISSLTEEDPEKAAPESEPEAEDGGEEEKAPAAEPPAATPEKEEVPPEAEKQAEDLNPTLDSLVRAIKEIRSGFGSGDSSIEAELSRYFDRLEDAERVSLIVMLRSLGDIMRKEADGASALEPSQYDVIMSMKSKEKSAPAPAASSKQKSAPPPENPAEEPANTPPIVVGQAVSEAYRAKIKSLLRRSY